MSKTHATVYVNNEGVTIYEDGRRVYAAYRDGQTVEVPPQGTLKVGGASVYYSVLHGNVRINTRKPGGGVTVQCSSQGGNTVITNSPIVVTRTGISVGSGNVNIGGESESGGLESVLEKLERQLKRMFD